VQEKLTRCRAIDSTINEIAVPLAQLIEYLVLKEQLVVINTGHLPADDV